MENKNIKQILELPPDIRLQYLAEVGTHITDHYVDKMLMMHQGNANIIYRILHPSTLASKCRLLRLHKAVSWIPSYARLHAAYVANIKPLFTEDQLVAQELVRLPKDVFVRLNAELRLAEHATRDESLHDSREAAQSPALQSTPFSRPNSRHGVYLDEIEVYGMLITDMTANATVLEEDEHAVASTNITLEFKPKWIVQSPNAPSGSRRCRTCALHAFRLSSKPGSKGEKSYFCPLGLVSGDRVAVAKVAQSLLDDQIASPFVATKQQLLDLLTEYLLNSDVLNRLEQAQRTLDQRGILGWAENSEEPSVDFLTATTLRDCTLFLRISSASPTTTGELVVDARLGDLDLKEPEPVKVAQWRETEEMLIHGGWYSGATQLPGGDVVVCHFDKEHNS